MSGPPRAHAVFTEVYRLPAAARRRELDRLCGGDRRLRDDVARLLDNLDRAEDEQFLVRPFVDLDHGDAVPAGGAPVPPLPERLGRYAVTGVLGVGSSGTVYRAEAPAPGQRTVAIKLLPSPSSPSALERSRAEIRILASLNHPGIAHLYDWGELDDGRLYVVLELVEGEPVTVHVRTADLSWRARLGLMLEICDAVGHAHEHGIIHRDLKPANILVGRRGDQAAVKILDFGVAALAARPRRAEPMAGTPAYMSPEQLMSDADPSSRSDIYAVGILLHEVLEGAHPFESCLDDLPALLDAIRRGIAPGPRGVRHGARRAMRAVIRKATHADPAERYPTIGHLADEIERILAHRPVHADRPGPVERVGLCFRRHPRLAPVATVAALTVLTLTSLALRTGQRAAAQRTVLQGIVSEITEDSLRELRTLSGTSDVRLRLAQHLDHGLASLRDQGITDDRLGMQHLIVREALGDALYERGQLDEALAVRMSVVEPFSRLYASAADDIEIGRSLARVIVKVGDTLRHLGDPRAARRRHDEAHAVILALRTRAPDHQGVLDDLAWSLERRSYYRLVAGDVTGAERLARERLAIAADIHRRWPFTNGASFGLASAQLFLADILFQQDRDEAALAVTESAAALARATCTRDPNRFDFARLQLLTQRRLAVTLLQMGRFEHAAEVIVQVRAAAASLVAANPEIAEATRLAVDTERMIETWLRATEIEAP